MDSDQYYRKISLKEAGEISALQSPDNTFLFRGQTDATWELETSLDRFLKHISEQDKSKKVEVTLVEEFQRRSPNYVSHLPPKDNRVAWWALMQHYGAPTRLLDWTYSYYVGLFFAIEDIENNCREAALWAIDADWLGQRYREKDETLTRALEDDPHMSELETLKVFKDKAIVLRINPFFLHERLTVQQGCFLIPGNASVPFYENLIKFADRKDNLKEHLYKIIIPGDDQSRAKGLEALFRMNISRASLFPGLDGYARSLKTMIYSMPKLLNKPELLKKIEK